MEKKYCHVPEGRGLQQTPILPGRNETWSVNPITGLFDGLKGSWSVSRHCPEPRQFVGDPASLARDNI